jgi:hypothetical protein
MLLDSTSGRCCTCLFPVPVTVGKASPSSCNGKSLPDCPIHIRNSKTSCSPAAVQAIQQQLSSLHKAAIAISCS